VNEYIGHPSICVSDYNKTKTFNFQNINPLIRSATNPVEICNPESKKAAIENPRNKTLTTSNCEQIHESIS
jgi:RNA recognition motif-containing protein